MLQNKIQKKQNIIFYHNFNEHIKRGLCPLFIYFYFYFVSNIIQTQKEIKIMQLSTID